MSELLKKTESFATGLDHPECVAVHIDGTVWAGGEAGQVYCISSDGKDVTEFVNTGGFILGIAFSPGCEWLAICDSGTKCVWKYELYAKKIQLLFNGAAGHHFNIPNFPVFDAAGNLYVSDSGAFNTITGKILKYSVDGEASVWHDGPFSFTNGMALDSKQEYLYVVSSWLPGVEKIQVLADGSAGRREIFCTMPKTVPDGLAFDEAGNLYISCYAPNAIYKAAPDGQCSLLIDDWEAHTLSNPTNMAFGGPNHDQLFTANLGRWHITKIDIGTRGLPLVSHQKK